MSARSLGFATLACAATLLLAVGARAETVYTGDKVQGVPVISQLDVSDLEGGKTHRFMFQGVETGTGEYWHVPVMVAKGASDGKRLLLVSGVHGDELTPMRVVQDTLSALDAAKLSGTVIGVIGASPPGVQQVSRMWPMSNLGLSLINPNRTWPGDEDGNTVERHSWLLMNRLFKGNADIGVDIHTGGNGIDFALFAFVNKDDAEARQVAELFPIDQILLEPGFDGTLEYALVRAGISSITLELGGPRRFEPDMVEAGVLGVRNLLSHYDMLDVPLGQTAKDRELFVGNQLVDLFAVASGYTDVLVKLNDTVTKGQKVAVQRNAFGDVVHEYIAPADGRVAIIGTDAIRERGVDIVSILANSAECEKGGCPYTGDME